MSQQPTDPNVDREATDPDYDRRDPGVTRWVSIVAALVGLWVAASPFLYEVENAAMWNNLVVGAAIFLLAGYNYYRMNDRREFNVGSAGLTALLGLWLIIAPFLFGFGNEVLVWSTIVSGAIVAILSGYNAYRWRDMETTPAGART